MGRYTVRLSSRVREQLVRHSRFLANVSISATKRFRASFEIILKRLEDNPYQFPVDFEYHTEEKPYRKALFGMRYKALFIVDKWIVWIDSVIDCRQHTLNLS